jgi:hypothetical protein
MPQPRRPRPLDDSQLETHFVRSGLYRVVHADGVWGGLTNQANISMGMYSEHVEAPDSVTYRLEAGKLSELSRRGKERVLRELEVEVIISASTARSLRDWLDTRLQELEMALAAANETPTPSGSKGDQL